jgi:predicted  nucleic acid-binding Zn-ribbon protein
METTNMELEHLIALNEVDALIVEIREQIELYPSKLRQMEERWTHQQKKHQDASARFDKALQQRRSAEKEVLTIREKIRKEQAKLMGVKSNKEYDAVLQEINAAGGKIDAWEMTGLEQLELEEKAGAERDLEKEHLDRLQPEQQAEKSRIDGMIREKQERLDKLEKEREPRLGQLDDTWVDDYELLMERYPGAAVVALEGNHCSGCNWRLVASTIQHVRENRNVVRCEHCQRVLYLKS